MLATGLSLPPRPFVSILSDLLHKVSTHTRIKHESCQNIPGKECIQFYHTRASSQTY